MATAVTRRSVLAVIGVGLGAALTGCDSSEAPSVGTASPGPARPTGTDEPDGPEESSAPDRSTVPDEAVLLLALERSRTLAARCRRVRGATGRDQKLQDQVQSSLDEQTRVLQAVLETGNVSLPERSEPDGTAASTGTAPGGVGDQTEGPDAGATTAPGDSAGSTGSPPDGEAVTATADPAQRAAADLRALGRDCLEDVTPDALSALRDVSTDNLPMLLAIAGQRGATAHLFGNAPQWPELAGPTGEPAAALLDAYRPAVYGFEVLAARASGDERTAYEAVISPLRAQSRQLTQLAGDAASPAPLGYGLPPGAAGPERRTQLASDLLAVLPPTIMAPTKGFVGDPAAISGSVRLLADAVRLSQPWRPVTGFPGMRVPGA